MGRIEERFEERKQQGRKTLITFITAGDPDLNTTVRLAREMEQKGADIIEIGIPYSDPIAEGPVIQAANARALKNAIKISDIMRTASEIRKIVKAPLLFMLYCNSILKYGVDRFFEDSRSAGVDGVIVVDLPYEERDEMEEVAERNGISMITLVTPTSRDRVEKLARNAKGFLYCVSSLGVTGVRNSFSTDFEEFFQYVNKATTIPKALGFGISTAEHVKQLKGYCDGLIVGSAMVKRVETAKSSDEAVEAVGNYTAELRAALDE